MTAEPTYQELIDLLDSNKSNMSISITNARRAVLLRALRLAVEWDKADTAIMTKRRETAAPFSLLTLTFGERYQLGQLRDGPIEIDGNHTSQPVTVLKNKGLITVEELTGDRAGFWLLTMTDKGRNAR